MSALLRIFDFWQMSLSRSEKKITLTTFAQSDSISTRTANLTSRQLSNKNFK